MNNSDIPVRLETVDQLMALFCEPPTTPHSDAFKAGMRAAFEYRMNRRPVPVPFAHGTTEADAYAYGLLHGHGFYRQLELMGAVIKLGTGS